MVRKGQVEVPVMPSEQKSDDQQDGGYEDYSVVGTFNPLTGKFQKEDGASYFEAKGLAVDRDRRMVEHYMDWNEYQQQMQLAAANKKKKKQPNGTKKFWKERKEKKKRLKKLAEYLKD